MLPVVGVGSRHVVALQERADVVDFEERDRGLRLSVGVKDLPNVSIAPRPVGVAAAVLPVVGDDNELEHVVVQWCFRHQLLLPRPYLVLTKPLRLDIQCQRSASVKIGWKYLDD